jgi:hypothetical protein
VTERGCAGANETGADQVCVIVPQFKPKRMRTTAAKRRSATVRYAGAAEFIYCLLQYISRSLLENKRE